MQRARSTPKTLVRSPFAATSSAERGVTPAVSRPSAVWPALRLVVPSVDTRAAHGIAYPDSLNYGGTGPVSIRGDVIGGSGDSSGTVVSYGKLASCTIGGSVRGGAGMSSGRIHAGRDTGVVTI